MTDPLSRTTTDITSAYGLPIETQFADMSRVQTSFLGTTLLDEADRSPESQTDESNRSRQSGYDVTGGLSDMTDLAQNQWNYAYSVTQAGEVVFDVENGEVEVVYDAGFPDAYRYQLTDEERDAERISEVDTFGHRLSQITSPEGEVLQRQYTPFGRIRQINLPNGGTETRTYGADGEPDSITLAHGTVLTLDHDPAGRLLTRTGTDGSSLAFSYLPGDRLGTMADATGTTTFLYDAAGRNAGLMHPNASGAELARDPLGQITTIIAHADRTVDPTDQVTGYSYDATGNVTVIEASTSPGTPSGAEATLDYDAVNRLTTRTLPNGVTTTWDYDARDRVTSVAHALPSGTVIASRTYARSPSGEPTRITNEDGSFVDLTYDPALRIESERYFDASSTLEEEITYAYDADGNRTSKTTSAGTETYEYTVGSLLTRITRGSTDIATFSYDGAGRLIGFNRNSQTIELDYDTGDQLLTHRNVTTAAEVQYAQDGQGRLVGRTDTASGSAISYVVAPTLDESLEAPHLITDATGQTLGGYLYQGEHAFARLGDSGVIDSETVYYLRDAQGSVIGLVNQDATETATIHYDGFGNIRAQQGTLTALPVTRGGDFRFHGMWLDAQTSLYDVRARTYDPQTARFATRDPADGDRAEPETFVPYVFANNNPYVFRDPSGLVNLRELGAGLLARAALALTAINAAGSRFLRFLQRGLRAGQNLLQIGARFQANPTTGAFRLDRLTNGILLRNALTRKEGNVLTPVGRALTKHPELLGFTKANLRNTLRTSTAIDAAAEGALAGILRSGTAVVRELGRFGKTIEIRAPSGFGARFSAATNEFIGFIGP